MDLWELSRIAAHRPETSVPEWTLGCFRRRSITFFDGTIDTTTEVIWLQARGLTADFRLPPARPRLLARDELRGLDPKALTLLLDVEAGVARTHWDGGLMSWHDWVAFQPQVKWPEPGALRRVGDCLIEFAPSGAYVEDWRFEPPGPGPLIGLELVEERDARDGTLLHQGGALLVCGRHAAFVRGRPPRHEAVPTPTAPLQRTAIGEDPLPRTEQMPSHLALEARFACEASYALVDAARSSATIVASTSPWREGQGLFSVEGFEYDRENGRVLHYDAEDGRLVERHFAIDTLEPTFAPALSTPVTDEGRAWRDRESATLLRYAHGSQTEGAGQKPPSSDS